MCAVSKVRNFWVNFFQGPEEIFPTLGKRAASSSNPWNFPVKKFPSIGKIVGAGSACFQALENRRSK